MNAYGTMQTYAHNLRRLLFLGRVGEREGGEREGGERERGRQQMPERAILDTPHVKRHRGKPRTAADAQADDLTEGDTAVPDHAPGDAGRATM